MSGDARERPPAPSAWRAYAGEVRRAFAEDGLSLSAQAVAYKLTVAAIPVVGLALAVLSRAVGASARSEAADVLGRLLPPEMADGAISLLLSLDASRGPLTLASGAAAGAAAVLLFSTFRRATELALRAGRRRGLVAVAFDVRMAVLAGGLFLGAIVVAVGLGTVGTDGLLERLLPSSAWTRALSGGLGDVLAVALPMALGLGVAVQVFRLVPHPRPPWPSVWAGALVTAATWEVARVLFGLYLGQFGPLRSYSGPLSTLGAGLAALSWAYLTGLALLLGAVVCRVHEDRRAARLEDGTSPAVARRHGNGARGQ